MFTMEVKWEYKVIELTYMSKTESEKRLNILGEEGWEVASTYSVADTQVILKRQKIPMRNENKYHSLIN